MIEANEVNSTFYALRLLSHGLDTSQIEVTEGEEYPGSEFTREEQEQALEIIHHIEGVESVSINQISQDQIDFYVTSLADRIEELANSDLANAGYALEPPRAPFFQAEPLSPEVAAEELTARKLDLALAEINPQLKRILELRYIYGYRINEIAELMDLSGAVIRVKLYRAQRRLRRTLTEERLSHDPAQRT